MLMIVEANEKATNERVRCDGCEPPSSSSLSSASLSPFDGPARRRLSAEEQRQRHHHKNGDPHVRGRWLSDVILGAQDGIVNTLGVVLGVASATADAHVIFATGMAAAVAESISMAAVAYTSSLSRGDLYRAERAREYRHLEHAPDVERSEIRDLFAAKGFEGDLLDRAVDTVCSNRDTWVAMMMSEEHGLADVDRRASVRSSAVVGGASLVASVTPVLPLLLARSSSVGNQIAIALTLVVSVLLLLALGALKARMTTGSKTRSALGLATIGIVSALAGYVVGKIFA